MTAAIECVRATLSAKLAILTLLDRLPDDAARVKALRDLAREIAPTPRRAQEVPGQLQLRIVSPPDPAPEVPADIVAEAVLEKSQVVATEPPIAAEAPKRAPHAFMPKTTALDETVAIAMKCGRISAVELQRKKAMRTRDGADKRLLAGIACDRLVRASNGVYEASEEEYTRIGIPAEKHGKPLAIAVEDLVKMIAEARIAEAATANA